MLRISMILIIALTAQMVVAQETYVLDEKTDQWVLTHAPEPGTPEGQLALASKQLAEGHYQEAARLSTMWIERHKRHPLIGEAHLIHGDALFAQKYYYESLFDYEIVARDYYDTQAAVAANERELEIATLFANGMLKIVWGFRISDATREAEELLIRIQERLPRSLLAETAALELADFYYRTKKMKLSNDMYLIFIENYPSSEFIEKAKARLIYTRLATYRGPAFDSSGIVDAKNELDRLERFDPRLAKTLEANALITRIDESLGQKMLRTAQWYIKVNNPVAAEYTVRRLLKKYPQTASAIEALEHLVPEFMPLLPPIIKRSVSDLYVIYQELLLGRVITIVEVEDVE
jgi:outer membrane protein assembly factor BamD (BamD/ComL family)